MNLAYTMQKFQDWFTQQWVILWGRKIQPSNFSWLMGPFGELNGIGEAFIYQLAEKENLKVERGTNSKGLLSSFGSLSLKEEELSRLSIEIINFYEHTADYQLKFSVNWNPIFKIFGLMVNRLFSRRINQLNIPTGNIRENENLSSEIIELIDVNDTVRYTVWLRKFESTGKVIYSGIYRICQLDSSIICVKAVFPLPKGNATVIMKPSVGLQGEFILESKGKKFGDAGFYFLLNDSKHNYWAQFISSFTDKLVVRNIEGKLTATQVLKLFGMEVVTFNYDISRK